MTAYYCDLGAGTFVDRSGVDGTTNVLTGPAGLQAAIRGTGAATPLAAGDTIYLKGTADLTRLLWFDCNAVDVTGWQIGDPVENYDAPKDWSGVIVQLNYGATDRILVWLDEGYTYNSVTTGDGIKNTAVGADPAYVDPITSRNRVGIEIDTASGTVADGFIKFIGVNSSWVNDGTRFVFTGGNEDRRGIDVKKNRIWIENGEFTALGAGTSYGGLYINTSSGVNCQYVNLYFHANNRCVSVVAGSYAHFIGCIFDGGDYGISGGMAELYVHYCKFKDQTVAAITTGAGESQVSDCLFQGCAIGIAITDDIVVQNCTFIGVVGAPAGIGIDYDYGGQTAISGCRFCYLGTGIDLDATLSRVELFYCYFGGNTADIGGAGATHYDIVPHDGASTVTLAGSDTLHGFIAPATGDFNLDPDTATYYNQALVIDA